MSGQPSSRPGTAFAAALATLLAAGGLSACGAQTRETGEGARTGGTARTATAAPGVFALVAGAPAGFTDLAGTATLADGSQGGSDVSITLSGLRPNVRYLAHVHEGTCDQPDPGGPHLKFDPDGADTPPNEIHLRFASNATRHASAQVHSARRVPDGAAGSIVVHTDAPASASAEASPAAPGHAHHGRRATGAGTANPAGGHAHAAKIACAALSR